MDVSFVILVFSGALAGVLAGLFGIGGGIVTVPVLLYVFEMHGLSVSQSMPFAVSTSLACIVVTATVSALSHARKKSINWGLWRQLAPLIAFGALLGGGATSHVEGRGLMALFVFFAYAMSLKAAGFSFFSRIADIWASFYVSSMGRSLIGLSVGLLSSLLGIGGGTLTVPLLLALNVPPKQAVGTGAALGLSVSIPAVLGVVMTSLISVAPSLPFSLGSIHGPSFFCVSLGGVLFAPLGAKIAHKIPDLWLKRGLALLLFIVGSRMLIKLWV